MLIQELIEKFKRNECDEFEKAEVLTYLEANPDQWDQILNEVDYGQFEREDTLDPAVTNRMFDTVRKSVADGSHTFGLWRMTAAASVLLLAAFSWLLLHKTANKNVAGKVINREKGAIAQLEERVNKTDKSMALYMEDGSLVSLSPNSEIHYYKPFAVGGQRTVVLMGQASFNVVKGPSEPFVVFSGELSTTVLGTSFTVSAGKEDKHIKVALHEGKVMVRTPGELHKGQQSFILVPGDEITYNRDNMLAFVTHPSPSLTGRLTKAGTGRKEDASVRKPEWYMFSGSPLSHVLDQLSDYYQVDIYYYPPDLQNKYFTTTLKKTDSLRYILDDIALLNKLTLEYKNGAYYFRKKTN